MRSPPRVGESTPRRESSTPFRQQCARQLLACQFQVESLDSVPHYGVHTALVEIAAEHLTIGQVASNAGVGVETVRFYERQGLIERPGRRPSGYRQYQPDVVRRIRFIQHAKELGFSLHDVAELLALRVASDGTCAAVRERAQSKIEAIDAKIAALSGMRRALLRLSEMCDGSGPASECPILEALDQESNHASG